jgi:hypothetical protein
MMRASHSLDMIMVVAHLGQGEQRPCKDEDESEGASSDVGPP